MNIIIVMKKLILKKKSNNNKNHHMKQSMNINVPIKVSKNRPQFNID